MKRISLILLFLLCVVPVAPVAFAQSEETQTEQARSAFLSMIDRGEARELFGLPLDQHWRPSGTIKLGLMSDGESDFRADFTWTSQLFAEATGFDLDVQFSSADSAQNLGEIGVNDIAVIIGPRAQLTVLGLEAGINPFMVQQFELSYWPFMFTFQRSEDGQVSGQVFLAQDEPVRALKASFVLIMVWAIGGVTLGPELEGLIDPTGETAALTPLGTEVFSLFGDPDLTNGLSLQEVRQHVE